jgi:hypothetical protein
MRLIRIQTSTAATSANTKPQLARPEAGISSGNIAESLNCIVCGKLKPFGSRHGPRTSQSRNSCAT